MKYKEKICGSCSLIKPTNTIYLNYRPFLVNCLKYLNKLLKTFEFFSTVELDFGLSSSEIHFSQQAFVRSDPVVLVRALGVLLCALKISLENSLASLKR